MKCLLLALFLGGTLFAQQVVITDDNYVSIFDNEDEFSREHLSLIRLYKVVRCAAYEVKVPAWEGYSDRFYLLKFQCGWVNDIHYDFSAVVDTYIERLGFTDCIPSPYFPGQVDFIISLPGEIIHFDDEGNPRSVQSGAFQYTLDRFGCCYKRQFVGLSEFLGFCGHKEASAFLKELRLQGKSVMAPYWCKDLCTCLALYKKEIGEDFV